MPTSQPSNAPTDTPPQAGDDATAAAVLNDEQLDVAPGGGLRGPGAGNPAGGSLHSGGGQTPNRPGDVPTPGNSFTEAQAGHEAAVRAAGADAAEDHPSSQ